MRAVPEPCNVSLYFAALFLSLLVVQDFLESHDGSAGPQSKVVDVLCRPLLVLDLKPVKMAGERRTGLVRIPVLSLSLGLGSAQTADPGL